MRSSAPSRPAPLACKMLSALVCLLIALPASADLILTGSSGSATAHMDFFGTLPGRTDEELFGPFGGIAVAELGRIRAAQTGSGLNAVTAEARLSDIRDFSFRADTGVEWTVSNDDDQPEDLIFQYTINGGELRLFDQRGTFTGLEATVGVRILTPSSGLNGFFWFWGVTLRATAPGVVVAVVHGFSPLSLFDDPFGLGSPGLSAVTVSNSEAVVSIAPFTATVNLGQLSRFLSGSIKYDMYGEISGPAVSLAGGQATIGDPFNLQGSPGSALAINGQSQPIPEPSALALTGLVLIILLRRRAASRDSSRVPERLRV